MTLHKVCMAIDTSSDEWRQYCLWRNYNFTGFASLDSSLRKSAFSPSSDEDWQHAVTNGQYLTGVVSDFSHALSHARKIGADEILRFDFAEHEVSSEGVLGYEILDGAFDFSLLTNFGNDISIVNNCLSRHGLINQKNQAILVHQWFKDHMPDDDHVIGSRIFAVYETHRRLR